MESIPTLLYSLIQKQNNKTPDALAILAPGKQPLTYRKLAAHLETIAVQLNRFGFQCGDRVALVLPNGPEIATVYLAVSSVCTCVPLNPAYQVNEFAFSMKDLRAKALITSFGFDHPACQAAASLDLPVLNLVPDTEYAGLFCLSSNLPMDENVSQPILAGMDETALVLHTSGTTSRPKIVPITHRNIFFSVHNTADCYELTSIDRCLNMMPLFHIHGLIGALSASMAKGASVICAPGYIPDQVMGWLADLAPTWYTAVPTIHQAVLEQAHHQKEKIKTGLRFIRSCSSSLPPQVGQDLEATFGVPVLEAYGMTEATHQMASNPLPPRGRKFGSVGLPTGTTNISILDVQGEPQPKNTLGEICIRGENVMAGYENNPSANSSSFINGWLRTGDLGVVDGNGYLFIQGRIKELINRGGEKISPREIDDVLLTFPAVLQAVAFAVPHATLGEDVAAAIVLRDGQTISAQELRQFAALHLVDFKVPRQIVFLKEIPKGPTGKIQRIGLADKLKPELDALRVHTAGGQAAQLTPMEADILAVWKDVLGSEQIGIQDDFLALGGDSIQASTILLRLNEQYAAGLLIEDFFSALTISTQACIIQEKINSRK